MIVEFPGHTHYMYLFYIVYFFFTLVNYLHLEDPRFRANVRFAADIIVLVVVLSGVFTIL